jgi:hypothetical protein
MCAPCPGDTITYIAWTAEGPQQKTATAIRIEGNLCWADYGNGDISPFIWRFQDGLNTVHDWPGKAGQ